MSSQALVVNVSKYAHLGKLKATNDATSVRDVLASPEYCDYPPECVTVLEDEAATRNNILAALEATCDAGRDATARTFVYFSGHGGQAPDGSSYILPVDTQRGQYSTTAISARDLTEVFSRCQGQLMVVLDCCRAAAIANATGMASADLDQQPDLTRFTDDLRTQVRARNLVVFAASREDGKAYISPDAPISYFTGHMVAGLMGEASTHGGDITVSQLYEYIQSRVISSARGAQNPVFIARTESLFELTRYPRPVPRRPVFEHDAYISYDHDDPAVEEWVTRTFQPSLEAAGFKIRPSNDLAENKILAAQEAVAKSRYCIVILTPDYVDNRSEEFKATLAVTQAVETRSPRFIPITRKLFDAPLWMTIFVGLDMRPTKDMRFQANMDQLFKRLRKQPHER